MTLYAGMLGRRSREPADGGSPATRCASARDYPATTRASAAARRLFPARGAARPPPSDQPTNPPVIQMKLAEIHLHDLKQKTPADLLIFAEELEVENASNLRKQDMMFAILKQLANDDDQERSEEHTSELQSLMRISYAAFCLKRINKPQKITMP